MNVCRSRASSLPVLVALLLASGAALAQNGAPVPSPRINRNPEFRENLPPGPPVAPDPRDSSKRPVQPPGQLPNDGRSVLQPGEAAPQLPPSGPASAPVRPAPVMPPS
jgi:hypothetical protein